VGEFFATLPDVFRALWQMGDPRGQGNGFIGLAIMLGYAALAVVFLLLARLCYGTRQWLSAMFGMMAGTIAMFWFFGILPSAWVYFADGNRPLLEGTVIPAALPGMDNFYVVFRDLVVIVETTIAVIGLAVVAAWVQKRYPRTLAEGEDKGPASGGYK
jgi:hypothetical protein